MPEKKVTFEKALEELEGIIANMEADNLTLDKALEYFEKGVGLMRVCDGHLKKAEGKLKELLSGADGEFIEKTLGMTLGSVTGGEQFNE